MTTDAYGAFITALRGWIADHGSKALAQSFYGRPDAVTADVPDVDAFPLFGLLHYLIRSQGCSRVLESGTFRGVSAACLASAVAHRADHLVVTMDPVVHEERYDLWDRLPEAMRHSIYTVQESHLGNVPGTVYHAALLDSRHDEAHVWAEFQLAKDLVCPGGLILIHDAILPGHTVGAALDRIRHAGYGVTTLWASECGAKEDAGLGLAVIENRVRR